MADRKILACALLLSLASVASLAQQDPVNRARGLSANAAYQIGDIDAVNLYNGNLTLALPLGGSYPVGGPLSYGLVLHYNSGIWELVDEPACMNSPPAVEADPEIFHNAGLGWRLSLGELYPPNDPPWNDSPATWLYVAPDGSKHTFFPTLHNFETVDPTVFYTRDGTYLRLKLLASGEKTLEFPDGTIHTFQADNRLRQMAALFKDGQGAYTDVVNVTYSANEWDLTDSQGRVQRIVFRTAAPGAGQVDHVSLTAFGGAGATATYQLNYADTPITRYRLDSYNCDSDQVTVPLLSSVTLPDGSAYSMAYSADNAFVGGFYKVPGTLVSLALPTFGRFDYVYQTYTFRHPASGTPMFWLSTAEGVRTKTVTDVSGALLGTWTYEQAARAGSSIDEQRMLVTSPLGHQTYHYFDSFGGNWTEGLPFTPDLVDATGTRNLSTEAYRGAAASGQLLRSTYLRFTDDSVSAVNHAGETAYGSFNGRVESERAVFWDDGGRTADVDYSGFDGLGHYRGAQTGGSFPGSNTRTTFVNYNAGQGVYHVDPLTNDPYPDNNFTMLASTAPWVLEASNFQWEAEGGNTAFTSACYDASTGFLLRRRTHLANGSSPGTSDLLAVFTADAQGNVAREQYYGGDRQAVSAAAGNLCGLALPASPVYRIDHTYQAGVLATSRYVDPASGAPLPFYALDQTTDAASGLVSASRDGAGQTTAYTYDAMDRVTSVAPPGLLKTTYAYTRAAAGVPAVADVTTSQTHEQILFDGLGRVWRETRLLPDVWNVRETLYDGAGNRASVSELQAGNPVQATQYLSYDPFGRPATVRPADSVGGNGFLHDVQLSYAGVRSVTRTVRVGEALAGGAVSELAATTTETYDRQGRLASVAEPAGAGGAAVTTAYGYDVGNRLATVSTTGSGATQTRVFAYDNRGLLNWENHPEKGAAGNGTVSYLSYDARGHAHRTIDGPNDLALTYDAAERVTEIDETGGLKRPLKTFQFATANAGADLANGKLRTASRYNYPVLGGTTYTSLVAQTYTYAGAGGRVSQRVLAHTFNGTASESFSETFSWDGLGHLATVGYPQCTFAACSGVAASPRTVGFSYTRGLLTGVPGYTGTVPGATAGITYSPNLLVAQVQHANGVLDTVANDPHAMPRPATVSAAGPSASWSSGAYAYDGAGNVTQIGGGTFLYDGVSRLASSTQFLGNAGGGAQVSQSFTYDAFGNLQSTAGANGATTPTSSSTNRLNGAGTAYDAAGNLTGWNGAAYEYDAFDQLKHYVSGSEEWLYMYDADDERAWSFKPGVPGVSSRFDRWTLRDLSGKVLRTYEASGYNWTGSVAEDDVYRNGVLLAAETSSGTRHFHLDHLGTPRLVTDANGHQVAYHVYYPFGAEATAFNQDIERMKFTGHERDLASPIGPGDDLDYMHARHASPLTGRFLSTDIADSAEEESPQSWNRYTYARNNPLRFVDLNGQAMSPSEMREMYEENQMRRDALKQTFSKVPLVGKALGSVADFVASSFLPTNHEEYEAFVESWILPAPETLILPKGEIAGLGLRLANIFNKIIDSVTVRAAAREAAGKVVALKATGEVFNHVEKFQGGLRGASRALERLRALVADPKLSPEERAQVQRLLSEYSKKLDHVKIRYSRILKTLKTSRD